MGEDVVRSQEFDNNLVVCSIHLKTFSLHPPPPLVRYCYFVSQQSSIMIKIYSNFTKTSQKDQILLLWILFKPLKVYSFQSGENNGRNLKTFPKRGQQHQIAALALARGNVFSSPYHEYPSFHFKYFKMRFF